MKSTIAVFGAFVLGLVVAFVTMTTVRAQRQNPPVMETESGLTVEQVLVASSCVVVVSKTGSGPSGHVAIAPCP